MPAQSSPHSSQEDLPPSAAELRDALQEEEEATQVMGREDLPDFEKANQNGAPQNRATANEAPDSESPVTERDNQGAEPERRPPQRPSTFTRLLIDPRR